MTDIEAILTVYQLAADLMKQHGLTDKGWTFELSNHKTFLGECDHFNKTISYSKYFLHVSPEQLKDTMLHEIAHALVHPKHGHDEVWRAKAIEIGARPERCAEGETTSAKYNWRFYCPKEGCTTELFRHRNKIEGRVICRRHRVKLIAERLEYSGD